MPFELSFLQKCTLTFQIRSSRGGLEVEQWTDNSTSLGSNPARRHKDFLRNSNTTGGALVNYVLKLMRLSSLD